jgi:hypothetical protein
MCTMLHASPRAPLMQGYIDVFMINLLQAQKFMID